MSKAYDLGNLDTNSFEHLANEIAINELGSGLTTFSPGSDGGRDGYFNGKAPYPSSENPWEGVWYIQSKFLAPHLSKDSQKWLLENIETELKRFSDKESGRKWPDNWILATNVDPSAVPDNGTFDKAMQLVAQHRPELKDKFHIWGGSKVLMLLNRHPHVGARYAHFLSPGHLITKLMSQLEDSKASTKDILTSLIVHSFDSQKYVKLDHAGSDADHKPRIHEIFVDVPYSPNGDTRAAVMDHMLKASSAAHLNLKNLQSTEQWTKWFNEPTRSPIWIIKGGPGQGKSTTTQFICQLNRAALILGSEDTLDASAPVIELARSFKKKYEDSNWWPANPRIPIYLELRDYAHWYGRQEEDQPRGILSYIANQLYKKLDQPVEVGTIRKTLKTSRWLVIFDGLDEVPESIKENVASEICSFSSQTVHSADCDMFTVCTTRPQGYSGQFDRLRGASIDLIHLIPKEALECAKPVLSLSNTIEEYQTALQSLKESLANSAVAELMTTPLQSHIMAVIVRNGHRAPERKWALYRKFFEVIKRREASRDLPDKLLARVLKEEDELLRRVHNSTGFVLHSRAETAAGAKTSINKEEFSKLVRTITVDMKEKNIDEIVLSVTNAALERLVLLNTPNKEGEISFDVRQLQEFFAAEFLYENVDHLELQRRLDLIIGDPHWFEVSHFLLSALIDTNRKTECSIAANSLRSLDTSDCPLERRIHERMARGALLATKLLFDGVLEADKKTRLQFGPIIDPLCSTPMFSELNRVSSLREESRTWFLDFLLDRIEKKKFIENIFVFAYLSKELKVDSYKFDKFQVHFKNLPDNSKSQLFECILSTSRPDEIVGHLAMELFFEVMRSEEWALDDYAIYNGNRILKSYENKSDSEYSRIVNLFTILSEKSPLTGQKCSNAWFDWYEQRLDHSEFDRLLTKGISDLDGKNFPIEIFFTKLFKFLKTPTFENFKDIEIIKLISIYKWLPEWVKFNLPSKEVMASLNSRQGSRIDTFDAWLKHPPIVSTKTRFNRHEQPAATSLFLDATKDHPGLGFLYWLSSKTNHGLPFTTEIQSFDYFQLQVPTTLDSFTIKAVESTLLESVGMIKNMVSFWGLIFKAFPALSQPIRKELCKQMLHSEPSFMTGMLWNNVHTFKLNLPSEKVLLRPIADELASFLYTSDIRDLSVDGNFKPADPLGLMVSRYIPDIRDIEELLSSDDLTSDILYAALLLGTFHPSGGIRILDEYALQLTKLIETEEHNRLGAEIGYWATQSGLYSNFTIRKVIADGLDMAGIGSGNISNYRGVLHAIRHKSTSPMTIQNEYRILVRL